jgi:acetylornithine deacetylase
MPSTDVLNILQTLIAFDTTSRNSNLGLIEWVRDRLLAQGVDTRLTYDSGGTKANLFATIGELRNGGLILSGHTDVVPVDGQDWSSDPFKVRIEAGKVFGRGTCDMKGFIACALASVPVLQRLATDRPFHLALSYDEELGCLGVRGLIADLAEQDIRPSACIVGEPTRMGVVVAHKGQRSMRCCVRGREAHTSDPDKGLNAIEFAAQIITQVQLLAAREAREGRRDANFTVPHSTLACTVVRGGVATNIVPRDCELTLDLRYLPGVNADAFLESLQSYTERHLLPSMKERCEEADVKWTLVNDSPPLAEDPAGVLAAIVARAAAAPQTGRVAYNTEAGLFQRAGIPTVVCGPGSIEQAHRPDEYVELEQISNCERFLLDVAHEFHPSTALTHAHVIACEQAQAE